MPRTPFTAVITGGGVAGLTLARLLVERGYNVILGVGRRGSAPTILLKDETVRLLLDVWGIGIDSLPPSHRLSHRFVRSASEHMVVSDVAWAMRADALQDRLLDQLSKVDGRLSIRTETHADAATEAFGPAVWRIDTRGRMGATGGDATRSRRVVCGRRTIIAGHAVLHPSAATDHWFFEAVPQGWLLTAAIDRHRAVVQLMVPESTESPAVVLREAVAASRLAFEAVTGPDDPVSMWHAAPAFDDPWPGPRAIRVGDAVMAFDPICGEGTGHAIRGALLAAAAIDAIDQGADAAAMREYYAMRLRIAWVSHLRTCFTFYASLTPRSIWTSELDSLSDTLTAWNADLQPAGSLAFRLLGSRLVRASSVASLDLR
jgi:2-polyprenyl-6-methoxyphenol hydroxylase-like FAD-dependent oxidoreductase